MMIVGIDASRSHSGGAIAHIIGLVSGGDPKAYGIDRVHIWSYQTLLDALPEKPWLIKHCPPVLKKSILHKLWWQRYGLIKEAHAFSCHIMFNADAGSVSVFQPRVVLSQDLLAFEKSERWRFGLTKDTLRLLILKYLHKKAMRSANAVIFLTSYAAKVIQQSIGIPAQMTIIPHGVSDAFRQVNVSKDITKLPEIRCVYVSNISMYKHQWKVVRAMSLLRQQGHNVSLSLVGERNHRAQKKLQRELKRSDPQEQFVQQYDFVAHDELPHLLSTHDVFIFASSCENMPITLLEAMASGFPIACSDRGPMPEVLENGGVFFDPENADSIAEAVKKMIVDVELKTKLANRARQLSEQYTWTRCANETWRYLSQVYSGVQENKIDLSRQESSVCTTS